MFNLIKVLAQVLNGKVLQVLAWRGSPECALPWSVSLSLTHLRGLFADIGATSAALRTGIQTHFYTGKLGCNRVNDVLFATERLECDGEPVIKPGKPPRSDLLTLPDGATLEEDDMWQRLLLLDDTTVPSWNQLFE